MVVYQTKLMGGITRSKEFERKKLASFAVNVGTKCGHNCCYCSTGTVLRMHPSFKEVGRSPFNNGYAIVDPDVPERVAKDAYRIRNRGLIQLCTVTDAWSPEAQAYNLGRRCLEAILQEPGWIVRILTKNAAVTKDFDLIKQYRDRVLLGLSLTATPDKSDVISVIEPYASPIRDRIAVMNEAHRLGLRTYAMLCPLLPGICDSPKQIDELIGLAMSWHAEEIFCEPVNSRGSGMRLTEESLSKYGYLTEATAVAAIRTTKIWSSSTAALITNIQRSVRAQGCLDRLRILLYPSRLEPRDLEHVRRDDAGVVWLDKTQQV